MTFKPVCDYAWLREMTIGALLDLLDQHGPRVSEEEWESLTGALVNILDYAAAFYDRFDHCQYEFALNAAAHVLGGARPRRLFGLWPEPLI